MKTQKSAPIINFKKYIKFIQWIINFLLFPDLFVVHKCLSIRVHKDQLGLGREKRKQLLFRFKKVMLICCS